MRKLILIILCVSCACAAVSAQSSAVSLANQEGSWFYFALDPKELEGMGAADPLLPGRLAGFFAKETDDFPFSALKPNSGIRLEGLSEGVHILVGFFVMEEDEEFPVRVIPLQVDKTMGERFYALYGQPAILEVSRGAGRLIQFARTKNEATPKSPPASAVAPKAAAEIAPPKEAAQPTTGDLQPEAELASIPPGIEGAVTRFPASFVPATFTREKGGTSSVVPISGSLFWAQKGTRISEVGGKISNGVLTLSLSASDGFSERVSYFLYLFKERSPGALNSFTLEVQPSVRGNRSLCLLWRRGEDAPRVLGASRTTGARCEVTIVLDEIPSDLASGLGGDFSLDLTSCMFDQASATYEEFPFATLSLAQLVGSSK